MKQKLRNLKNTKFIQLIIRIGCIPMFFTYYIHIKKFDLNIKNAEETINYLINNKVSVGRFGDGEFNILYSKKPIGFQKYSDELSRALAQVRTTEKFKIAIPYAYKTTRPYKFLIRCFWWRYVTFNNRYILEFKKQHENDYLDTNFSRVITELADKKEVLVLTDKVKMIWENRNVLIVEGKFTRFGVNNDLLSNTKSVKRIIAPAEDAFNKFEEIYKEIDSTAETMEDPLILVSLGPTATILAYKLSNQFQAIDIGHFDLQYQYLERGYYHKVRIKDRYDNESMNGDKVADIHSSKYEKEIVTIIR